MKIPAPNKKVQSLEQCSQLQLLKASSHRFELNYILYQNENLSQGRRAYYFSFLYTLTGITPRVREKRLPEHCMIGNDRITPACAGKTPDAFVLLVEGEDHPRVCGKNAYPNIA